MPKETNKKQSKDKKHFMKDFRAELKKVIWPTPKQLFNNTVAVITVVLITAAIVFVLDFAFEKMNEHGIEKIKSVVETRNTVEDTTNNEITNTNTDEETSEDTNTTEEDNTQNSNEVSENSVNE